MAAPSNFRRRCFYLTLRGLSFLCCEMGRAGRQTADPCLTRLRESLRSFSRSCSLTVQGKVFRRGHGAPLLLAEVQGSGGPGARRLGTARARPLHNRGTSLLPAPLTPRQVAARSADPGETSRSPSRQGPRRRWGSRALGLFPPRSPPPALSAGAPARATPRPSEALTASPGAGEGATARTRGVAGAPRGHVRAPPPGLQRSTRGEDAAGAGRGRAWRGVGRSWGWGSARCGRLWSPGAWPRAAPRARSPAGDSGAGIDRQPGGLTCFPRSGLALARRPR